MDSNKACTRHSTQNHTTVKTTQQSKSHSNRNHTAIKKQFNAVNNSALALKQDVFPTARLASQPFVVAGDIMLSKTTDANNVEQLVITRLYDNNRGVFALDSEQLTLLSNRDPVMIEQCETLADGACHSEAALQNRIVIPPSYRLTPQEQTPTAVSEWGVHWAVNPENSVLTNLFEHCAGRALRTGIEVESSYGKARVWTLRPVRAANMQGARPQLPALPRGRCAEELAAERRAPSPRQPRQGP